MPSRSEAGFLGSGDSFRLLVDSVQDYAIIMLDRGGHVASWNEGAERLKGYRSEEILGRPVSCFYSPDAVQRGLPEQDLAAAFDNGRFEDEGWRVRKDGTRFWASVVITALRGQDGALRGFSNVTRDLTEHKQAKDAQRASAAAGYVRSLIEASLDPLVTISAEGTITDVNSASVEATGVPRERLIGTDFSSYFTEPEKAREGYLHVFSDGFVRDYPLALRHVSGRVTHVLYNASVYKDENGNVLGVFAAARDVTARKKDEARIQRLTQLYAALSECNEAIARCTNEHELFRQVCWAAVRFGGMKMAWIGMVDESSRLVRPVASYGDQLAYLDGATISVNPDHESGKGPTGTSIRDNCPFWCQDFLHHPATEPWHDRGRRAGWSSSASLPLLKKGVPVGALTIYSDTVNAFDEEARTLLLEMAMDISFALDNFARDAERRDAESALRQNELYFRSLIENASDIISVVDRDGIIQFESPAVEQVLGYQPDELVGRPALEFVHPEDAPIILDLFARGFAAPGSSASAEVRFRHRDGSQRILEATGKAIVDAQGRVNGVINSRDVTERRRAERELRLQSAALNAAADAIVITDRDAKLVWCNPAFSALTGYGAEEAIGRNVKDLVKSGAHDPAFYKRLWETILAGDVWRGELTNRRKDGSLYSEEQTITPVRDARGDITHFIGIKRDLTEQKRLESQLLQVQKMESVGRLAGGIAHDFNNLLTVINGTSALAMSSLRKDDPLRQDLQVILQSGEQAASLTRQLLAFSRKQIMKPDILDLGALVENMRGMLRRLLGEDVELVVTAPQHLGSVQADPGQVEQVILNLAVNARDAMPTGGRLTIELRNVELDQAYGVDHPSVRPGAYVMLAVSDTGVGMDRATLTRVFEPFFTTKESGKGTGLGLATVYGIVKQSGGSIWAYSEPGKGTAFKVYLPRVDESARPEPTARPREAARGSETILVVEDDQVLCRLATRMLQAAGYTVLTAHSGNDAMATLAHHQGPVHLMLTDVVMPGMSGRELAASVAAGRGEIRVIYTSGYTDDAMLRHGVLDSTARFIAKPYTAEALTRTVREVLDE